MMGRRVLSVYVCGWGSDVNLVSTVVTIVGPLVNQGTNLFFSIQIKNLKRP